MVSQQIDRQALRAILRPHRVHFITNLKTCAQGSRPQRDRRVAMDQVNDRLPAVCPGLTRTEFRRLSGRTTGISNSTCLAALNRDRAAARAGDQ